MSPKSTKRKKKDPVALYVAMTVGSVISGDHESQRMDRRQHLRLIQRHCAHSRVSLNQSFVFVTKMEHGL
jgi:hypothetical protein